MYFVIHSDESINLQLYTKLGYSNSKTQNYNSKSAKSLILYLTEEKPPHLNSQWRVQRDCQLQDVLSSLQVVQSSSWFENVQAQLCQSSMHELY